MAGDVFRKIVSDICSSNALRRGVGAGYEPVGLCVCRVRASDAKRGGGPGRALYVCGFDGGVKAYVCQVQRQDFSEAIYAGQQCFMYCQLCAGGFFGKPGSGACRMRALWSVCGNFMAGDL